MSSLNQAFIKAYGRDGARPQNESAPVATATPPEAPQVEGWYAADTWYRAEPAAVPSAVPAPHAPFPAAYRAPTTADLSRLQAWRSEDEYRLSPPEPAAWPELVIEEESAEAESSAAPAAEVVEPVAEAAASPAETPAPAPQAAPALAASELVSQEPAVPTVAAYNFDQLCGTVEVISNWESALNLAISATAAAPPVAAPRHDPAPSAPPPRAEERREAKQEQPKAQTTTSQSAPPPSPAPAPANIQQPRLDAAAATPVPKPHTSFSPAASETAPAASKTTKEQPPAASAPKEPAPPAQPPVSPAAPPPPAFTPVHPAWEVDRFQWPDHCKQLQEAEQEYMTDVGQRLAIAARDGLNILAITSTRRGEGRTTLALCLAQAAARAGVKVALVDADIENPQLVNELGVEASCGWHDVVLGQQPLSEAAILSLEDKFTFFPWTSSGLKSLNDPRATRVLRQIAKTYSLVILDLGPVPGRETRLFEDGENCPVDAAILVRDVRWTSAVEAQRVAEQLVAAGVASVGIAENFGPRAVQQAA